MKLEPVTELKNQYNYKMSIVIVNTFVQSKRAYAPYCVSNLVYGFHSKLTISTLPT